MNYSIQLSEVSSRIGLANEGVLMRIQSIDGRMQQMPAEVPALKCQTWLFR